MQALQASYKLDIGILAKDRSFSTARPKDVTRSGAEQTEARPRSPYRPTRRHAPFRSHDGMRTPCAAYACNCQVTIWRSQTAADCYSSSSILLATNSVILVYYRNCRALDRLYVGADVAVCLSYRTPVYHVTTRTPNAIRSRLRVQCDADRDLHNEVEVEARAGASTGGFCLS